MISSLTRTNEGASEGKLSLAFPPEPWRRPKARTANPNSRAPMPNPEPLI